MIVPPFHSLYGELPCGAIAWRGGNKRWEKTEFDSSGADNSVDEVGKVGGMCRRWEKKAHQSLHKEAGGKPGLMAN